MPGKGKYTTYVPPKSPRREFLESLYKGSSKISPPFNGVDQDKAVVLAAEMGNKFLRASDKKGIQQGDPKVFPEGVDMTYAGSKSSIQAPDKVADKDDAWKKAGDPANAYVPDISSPGPGLTLGVDKDVDPKISAADIKPDYVPGGPDTGTRNPASVGTKLFDAAALGAPSTLGKSGGDV